MFDEKGRYIIRNYTKKSVFASFLPGISGKNGIPVWSFYVNRGQGITSFGSGDKDHSIMEFYPAHQAYLTVKKQGFRTFVKKDGAYLEPFSEEETGQNMYVGMNEFEIEEENTAEGLKTNVLYYTLPTENIGGLIREVTFTNTGDKKTKLEILDGMPALIPYGVSLDDMKNMGQTIKAWMQVEDVQEKLPYFRVRASVADSIAVQEVKEGNYSLAVTEHGEMLPVIVDPEAVFAYDTALTKAVEFEAHTLKEIAEKKQITENNLPCSFFMLEKELEAGESVTIYEVTGMVKSKALLREFAAKCKGKDYFTEKRAQAVTLTKDLCKGIRTKTGDPVFDAYCEQTYLDNLLRGGYPVRIGKEKIFYLYSRKHGDVERDYNYFQMSPEFYSQGNANFRDVNQNRRCDILFTPYVGDLNIKTFYNLIQTDGYNPLQVQKAVYTVQPEKADRLLETGLVKKEYGERLKELLSKPFTPGSLAGYAMNGADDGGSILSGAGGNSILSGAGGGIANCAGGMTANSSAGGEYGRMGANPETEQELLEQLMGAVLDCADSAVNASFGEGYWSDHWTYNLDLVETYLSVYPDKEKALLFDDHTYTYFESAAAVNPRKLRYEETEKGIRQYHTLDTEIKKERTHELVCTNYGKGEVYHGSLMEKLLLLCTVKFATLDLYGMGIEMEGGKPGWYDALNGLPGLLGSSMCETYELCRMLEFVIEKLEKYRSSVTWAEEMSELFMQLGKALRTEAAAEGKEDVCWRGISTWHLLNDRKEAYRAKTMFGLSGKQTEQQAEALLPVLKDFYRIVKEGIEKALDYGKGISPAYFTYNVTAYDKTEEGIEIRQADVQNMPYFLEGPVRYLKLDLQKTERKEMYRKVKQSPMYDKKLEMYKVNESLEPVSFEAGRSRAFTPGWLENESIWLHMEYKYLLELLKGGLYEEYKETLKKTAVPFLDEETYGRSPLENSSFIASSANHNEKIHGKGFVARLSGSTAEFIQMWQIMMFGKVPFAEEDGELALRFAPFIPEYLLDDSRRAESVFLGTIPVVYHLKERKDYTPGEYKIMARVTYDGGIMREYADAVIKGADADRIREGDAERIELYME